MIVIRISRYISLIKLFIVKLFRFKGLNFKFDDNIDLSTRLIYRGKGIINFANSVVTSKNVEIRVANNSSVNIGEACYFNNNCLIVAHEKIEIGSNCLFGPNVMIFDHDHDFRHSSGIDAGKYKVEPVVIGKNTWIGANVVILKGTKIGANCVIGAGAILNGEYPDNSLIIQKRDTQVISRL